MFAWQYICINWWHLNIRPLKILIGITYSTSSVSKELYWVFIRPSLDPDDWMLKDSNATGKPSRELNQVTKTRHCGRIIYLWPLYIRQLIELTLLWFVDSKWLLQNSYLIFITKFVEYHSIILTLRFHRYNHLYHQVTKDIFNYDFNACILNT